MISSREESKFWTKFRLQRIEDTIEVNRCRTSTPRYLEMKTSESDPREFPTETESEKKKTSASKMKRLCSYAAFKFFLCLLIPFALMPLALSKYKEARCGYVIVWMILYWTLQPVPIAVTSLLPVILMPLLGVLDSVKVAPNYMKEVLMMFLGGLGVAVAVEYSNLHKRIALKVLVTLGNEIKWLLLGFMCTSMFLSMWISNSATTAMMVPIVDAVMVALRHGQREEHQNADAENGREGGNGDLDSLHKILLMGVAYSSNFGGTGTITGTSPNMILKGFLESDFPNSHEITYASWMAYNVPGMIIGVAATWIILQVLYVPCWRKQEEESKERIKSVITAKYEEIGNMTFHEGGILGLFILLVILWIFRDPKFMPGWTSLINSEAKIGDSVAAIGVLFLMFLLPAEPWLIPNSPPLLKWNVVEKKLPWGLVLLLGGGYAMADGARESGLSTWMIHQMRALSSLSPLTVLFIVYLIATTITEFMSNSAVTSIFLPVVIQMAVSFRINPLYLMLPVPNSASYAFILPVSTGPNAIVFATGQLKTMDMFKVGLILKIICCALQLFMIHTLGNHLFHFHTFPSWANVTETPPTVITPVITPLP